MPSALDQLATTRNALRRTSRNHPIAVAGLLFAAAFAFRLATTLASGSMGASLSSKLFGIAVVFLYLHSTDRQPEHIGLHPYRAGRSALIACVVVLLAYGAAYASEWIYLVARGAQPSLVCIPLEDQFPLAGWATLLLYYFVNSFAEEGLFRGVLLPHLESRLTPWRANLVQAALFGLWHISRPLRSLVVGGRTPSSAVAYGIQYALGTTIHGLVWGYLYMRTNNLWAPWSAHTVTNLTLPLIILRATPDPRGLDPAIQMIGTTGIATCVASLLSILLIKKLTERFQRPQALVAWGFES